MCQLRNRILKKDYYYGWKVVAVKKDTGEYFSPATGIKYVSGERVTIPETALQICDGFMDVLKDKRVYSKKMIGRTAIFADKSEAEEKVGDWRDQADPDYYITAIKARVSKDVLSGAYPSSEFFGSKVYAGKVIEFLDG